MIDEDGRTRVEVLGDPALPGDGDGKPHRGCFGRRIAEVLRGGRQAERVRVRQRSGLLRAPEAAGHDHHPARPEARYRAAQLFERAVTVVGAHDRPPDTGESRDRLGERGEALLPRDAAEREHERHLVGHPVLTPERPSRGQRQQPLHVDAVGSDDDRPRVDAVFHELAGLERGGRDHGRRPLHERRADDAIERQLEADAAQPAPVHAHRLDEVGNARAPCREARDRADRIAVAHHVHDVGTADQAPRRRRDPGDRRAVIARGHSKADDAGLPRPGADQAHVVAEHDQLVA